MRAIVRTPLSSHAAGGTRRTTLRYEASPNGGSPLRSQSAELLRRYASEETHALRQVNISPLSVRSKLP